MIFTSNVSLAKWCFQLDTLAVFLSGWSHFWWASEELNCSSLI